MRSTILFLLAFISLWLVNTVGGEPILGEVKVLVIPLSFHDKPAPTTNTLVGLTVNRMLNDYIKEVSYGLAGVRLKVSNWVNLTSPWSVYQQHVYDRGILFKLLNETVRMSGEDITAYRVIMVVHTGPCEDPLCATGGSENVEGLGFISYSILPYQSPKSYYVKALLKALGLSDQRAAGAWTPTGTPRDPMKPPHPLSYEKVAMGWLSYGDQVKTVRRGELVSLTLNRLSFQSGVRAVVLPVRPDLSVWAEYRYLTGEDSGIPSNAVLAYVVASPGSRAEILSTLWVGDTFISRTLGLAIKVLSADPLSASLLVSHGLADISITSLRYEGDALPGKQVTVVVDVSNAGDVPSPPIKLNVKLNGVTVAVIEGAGLAPSSSGKFTTLVTLQPGENTIEAEAITEIDADLSNNRSVLKISSPRYLIVTSYTTARERVDVGTVARVGLKVVRDSDRLPAVGAVLSFAGEKYVVNETGIATIDVGSNQVGVVEVKPTLVSYYGVAELRFEVEPRIIFDVIELYRADGPRRVDVGSTVELLLYLRYAFDKKPFDGQIVVGNTMVDVVGGVARFKASRMDVEKIMLTINSVKDGLYGLTKVVQPPLELVWDEVVVELSSEKSYYNVGEAARITWKAYYAYDGERLEGDVYLSHHSPAMKSPTKLTVTVLKVEDRRYGLSKFRVVPLTIYWDRVTVTLSAPVNRAEVGSELEINLAAIYELDGTPFDGSYQLVGSPKCTEAGDVRLTVSQVVPGKRGITEFKSNELLVRCDIIDRSLRFEGTIFGFAKAILTMKYRSDNSPVEGKVMMNGKPPEGSSGTYTIEEPFYGFLYNVKASVKVNGFEPLEVEGSFVHMGNSLAYAGIIGAASLTAIRAVKSKRKKTLEEEVFMEEKLPETIPAVAIAEEKPSFNR